MPFFRFAGCKKCHFLVCGVRKKWKSWKSSERVGNEVKSFTVRVGYHCAKSGWKWPIFKKVRAIFVKWNKIAKFYALLALHCIGSIDKCIQEYVLNHNNSCKRKIGPPWNYISDKNRAGFQKKRASLKSQPGKFRKIRARKNRPRTTMGTILFSL